MSHYINSVAFLKIKPELLEEFKRIIDHRNNRDVITDDLVLNLYNHNLQINPPYYYDWFLSYSSVADYVEYEGKSSLINENGILVIDSSHARSRYLLDTIKDTIDLIADSYIVITKNEDDGVNYFLKNEDNIDLEYRHFYETFVIDQEKEDDRSYYWS